MNSQPRVTAILPVRGRAELARMAVECFLAQDYTDKVLMILQDADDLTFDAEWIRKAPEDVLVLTAHQRRSIPEKRNHLASAAICDLICHWDSDDYSAPARISEQVNELLESGKAVTGYRDMYFADDAAAYLYKGSPNTVLGTSLMYRRDWWRAHPFDENCERDTYSHLQIGEDGRFVKAAAAAGQLHVSDRTDLMVARIHPGNSSTKHPDSSNYKRAALSDLPQGFPADVLTIGR